MTGRRDDEERQLHTSQQQLIQQFAGRLPADVVEERFAQMVARFDGARVRTFVPVLAAKAAREQLRSASAA